MATPGGAGPDPAPASAPSSTVRSTVRTLLSFAETRARIAANEVEEQLLRLLEVAAWAVAAVFFFAIAVLLVCLFIVLMFWDSNRILAAGLLAGLFVAGGGVSVLMVRSCLALRPKFLAATLAEFEKDRQRMGKP
jgi:uncharacterized membrane protein YqjE